MRKRKLRVKYIQIMEESGRQKNLEKLEALRCFQKQLVRQDRLGI